MTKRLISAFLVALTLAATPLLAQELVTLTTPIAKPATSTMIIERIIIDVKAKSVMVQWLGNNGEPGSAVYPTPAVNNACAPAALQSSGAQILTSLNKMNFSGANASFVRRVTTVLQGDCYIPAGTISGTPE
jgi:hypothetical protein